MGVFPCISGLNKPIWNEAVTWKIKGWGTLLLKALFVCLFAWLRLKIWVMRDRFWFLLCDVFLFLMAGNQILWKYPRWLLFEVGSVTSEYMCIGMNALNCFFWISRDLLSRVGHFSLLKIVWTKSCWRWDLRIKLERGDCCLFFLEVDDLISKCVVMRCSVLGIVLSPFRFFFLNWERGLKWKHSAELNSIGLISLSFIFVVRDFADLRYWGPFFIWIEWYNPTIENFVLFLLHVICDGDTSKYLILKFLPMYPGSSKATRWI